MRYAPWAVIDQRLERLIVTRARRKAPVLEFVPARWIVAAARPGQPLTSARA